jgi:hypothetical protein
MTRVIGPAGGARLFALRARGDSVGTTMLQRPFTTISAPLLALALALTRTSDADEHRPAAANVGAFLLRVGDTNVGNVHASVASEKSSPSSPNLLVTSSEVTPSVSVLVDGFLAGKTLATSVRLSTPAVVKRTDRARLATVRLPSMGGGGVPEIELGFLAGVITTSPVLSSGRRRRAPPGRASTASAWTSGAWPRSPRRSSKRCSSRSAKAPAWSPSAT